MRYSSHSQSHKPQMPYLKTPYHVVFDDVDILAPSANTSVALPAIPSLGGVATTSDKELDKGMKTKKQSVFT